MNPNALDKVAEVLTGKDGTIIGVTEKASEQASVIDTMLYGVASPKNGQKVTNTDYIMYQAKNGANLFNHGGDVFAPNSVREANGWTVSAPAVQVASVEPLYIKEIENDVDLSFA
jgi:hypothetical protein